uniref:Kazal-like domain-containing protein n=1 Tax=Strigamia maritima TaxID=126957 RepID=T1IXD0_STRMM
MQHLTTILIFTLLLSVVMIQAEHDRNIDITPCKAKKIFRPICGDDGHTYANTDLLKCENEKREREERPKVEVKSRGPCPERD